MDAKAEKAPRFRFGVMARFGDPTTAPLAQMGGKEVAQVSFLGAIMSCKEVVVKQGRLVDKAEVMLKTGRGIQVSGAGVVDP